MSTLERSLAFFRPHHDELRKRLVKVFISITLCTVVAYFFSEQIALFFIKPLLDSSPLVYRLVYTNLPEAFIAYIKLALLVGIIASFPVLIYQVWSFVAPGLHDNEKKIAVTVVFWSSILFLSMPQFRPGYCSMNKETSHLQSSIWKRQYHKSRMTRSFTVTWVFIVNSKKRIPKLSRL